MNINSISTTPCLSDTANKVSNEPFFRPAPREGETAPAGNWSQRAIAWLNDVDFVILHIPNCCLQDDLDALARKVEYIISPITGFNSWINQNMGATWHTQFAIFLAKLPLKAARNIIQLLYNIIRTSCFALAHPMRAMVHLSKLIVQLLDALTSPSVWPKIGAGMVGASFGHALAGGHPLALISIVIGSALIFGGLSITTVIAAVDRERKVKDTLFPLLNTLPEAALTGFFMGIITGAIQAKLQAKTYTASSLNEARDIAHQYVQDHHLLAPEYVIYHPNTGDIILRYASLTDDHSRLIVTDITLRSGTSIGETTSYTITGLDHDFQTDILTNGILYNDPIPIAG